MIVWGIIVTGLLAGNGVSQSEPTELVRHGSFDSQDLVLSQQNTPGQWNPIIAGTSDAAFTRISSGGHDDSPCLQYRRTDDGSDNIHLDQVIPVQANVIYEVRAWVRSDGKLNPVLSVTTMKWRPLTTVPSNANTTWQQVHFTFMSTDEEQVRFEWFPGSTGKLYEGRPGTSWLDDVSIRAIPHPSRALRQAFELQRSQEGEEIDTVAIRTSTITRPTAIRPITCRNGTLVYDDGSEVALWGVNLQTALAWEYNSRLKPVGVPLDVPTLDRISDDNITEVRAMGSDVIRMHLCPVDFSDAQGNLRESPYLAALDHLIAQCSETNTYVYLTLINDMNTQTFPDSFMTSRERREWLFDPEFVVKTQRFVRALMSRHNRYTGRSLAEDPTIAVIEIMNEPDYLKWDELASDTNLAIYQEAFESWRTDRGITQHPEAAFHVWRYELVRRYIDELYATIRHTGARQPIIWNLNWPRMIVGHEDVFQAAADSSVEGISFCLYPGQNDAGTPHWAHPKNLDDKNYLPFLADNYQQYDQLRWVLGKRFAGKAKLVYEFETFYTQNSFLYPAMARLMRALGVQIAPMWTYCLTPYAEFHSGSHYLNYYCTPQKAASFAIAGEVFRNTPRYTQYDTRANDELAFDGCQLSASRNISAWQTADTLMHSRSLAALPFDTQGSLRQILACGSSPLVDYDGTGIYRVNVADDSIDVTINPDAQFLTPHWQRPNSRPRKETCKLDTTTEHRFALRLPGWDANIAVFRVEAGTSLPVANRGPGVDFTAAPGQYRIERATSHDRR